MAASNINSANVNHGTAKKVTCTNCRQSVSQEEGYCQTCGMPADHNQGEAKIGEIPFTYYVVLVAVFCACMMFYLPRSV